MESGFNQAADSWIPKIKGPPVEEPAIKAIEEESIAEDDQLFDDFTISEDNEELDEAGEQSESEAELDENQASLKFGREENEYFENLEVEVFDDLDIDDDEFDEVGYSMQIRSDLKELARKLRECRESRTHPRSALEEPAKRLLVEKFLQMRDASNLDAIRYLVIDGYSGIIVFPTTEICEAFWRHVTRDPMYDDKEMIISHISSFKLNTGARIPSVGLSTCGLEPGTVGSVVYYAVQAGYRRIDCAPSNQNEKEAYSPLGLEYKVLQNSTLLGIADKLGKTAAQVALRWGLQNGHSVLIRSTKNSRIDENTDIFDWELNFEQARLHSFGGG